MKPQLASLFLALALPGCDDPGGAVPADAGGADATPLDGAGSDATSDALAPDAALDAGAPDGPTVTWLAGGTTTGFVDGTGPAARFSGVTCIALAGDTLYAADTFNGTVRAVALANGAVTTLAGRPLELGTFDGPAAQVRFDSPRGCAAADGVFWIADGPTVRRLDLATGAATTVAGTAGQRGNTDGTGPAARFGFLIHDIEVAADGTLVLADRINNALRRLDPSTGEVTTWLDMGLDGPGGLARVDDVIYLADTFDGELLRIPPGGAAEVVADGFDTPQGVAVADGIAWLMGFDGLLHRVELATGEAEVALGSRREAFARDGDADTARLGGSFASPVIDGEGMLYFVDLQSNSIRRIDLATRVVTTLAGPIEPAGDRDGPDPRFGTLYDVVRGPEGWIVSDPENHTLRTIDDTGVASTLLGHPDQATPTDGPVGEARIHSPVGLAHDGQRLFVADYDEGSLRVVEAGAVRTLTSRLETPWGLGLGPDGRVYVTEIDTGAVKAVDLDGQIEVLAAAGTFDAPTDVAVGPDGRVYVADRQRAAVYALRPEGAPVAVIGRPGRTGVRDGNRSEALLGGPVGLTFAADGALMVVDGDNHFLRRFDLAEGRLARWLGHPVRHGNPPIGAVVPWADATFHQPQAVAFDGARAAVLAEQALSVAE